MDESLKYKLLEKLGEGTFAKVYKVEDQYGHKTAFKKYRVQEDDSECAWLVYFLRELSAISTLGVHPNIVAVDRIIFKPKMYALTMELMDGTVYSLFKKIHSTEIKESYIRDIAFQTLQALSHMERHQFAHRDVKGDNILYKKIEDRIVFKLSDFNLTRSTRGELYSGQISCLIHRPPEIWSIDNYGKYDASKVDMWGLGSTLYLLLVGEDDVAQTHESKYFFRYWSSILDMSSYTKKSCSYISGARNVQATSCCKFIGLEKRILDEFPKTNPLLIDFLKCLLEPNPSDRISAEDALNHPFLESCVPTKYNDLGFQYLTTERFDWTSRHPDLVPRQRIVLIDWLRDVSKEYKLGIQTFYVGVQYIDVYMQKCIDPIPRKKLQLVGCSAFCLAIYLLEFRPIPPYDWEYLTECAYDAKQILDFSIHMFQTLECKLPPPRQMFESQLDSFD